MPSESVGVNRREPSAWIAVPTTETIVDTGGRVDDGGTDDPRAGEERARMRGDEEGGSSRNNSREKMRIVKNIVVLGAAFMLHFTAFHGTANLQSSVNAVANLGTFTLASVYGSLILSNIFLPVIVIRYAFIPPRSTSRSLSCCGATAIVAPHEATGHFNLANHPVQCLIESDVRFAGTWAVNGPWRSRSSRTCRSSVPSSSPRSTRCCPPGSSLGLAGVRCGAPNART